ncbi:MAG: hypothetical protein WAR22_08320 [Desulfomonilia bacterium]|jgi:hypothetical protein
MNGLVREIIRKPTFKDILRGHLNNMSAEGGRRLVRDLIWQDFEAVFGLMGSLPAFINACAGGLAQLVSDLDTKISPRLLKDFIASIIEDVDKSELKELGEALSKLAGDLLAASPELTASIVSKGPALIAGSINAGTAGINSLCREDPQLLSSFLSEVIRNIDKPAFNEATLSLAEAVLDQKTGLLAWTFRLIARRVQKIFRRF